MLESVLSGLETYRKTLEMLPLIGQMDVVAMKDIPIIREKLVHNKEIEIVAEYIMPNIANCLQNYE